MCDCIAGFVMVNGSCQNDTECPGGQVWSECHTACPRKCGEPEPLSCIDMCVTGCGCAPGMWVKGDECVELQDCPKPLEDLGIPRLKCWIDRSEVQIIMK
eukprot:UN27453